MLPHEIPLEEVTEGDVVVIAARQPIDQVPSGWTRVSEDVIYHFVTNPPVTLPALDVDFVAKAFPPDESAFYMDPTQSSADYLTEEET